MFVKGGVILIAGGAVDIRSSRKVRRENWLAFGFNTTIDPTEPCLLTGEIAEAFDACRKVRPDVVEKLANGRQFAAWRWRRHLMGCTGPTGVSRLPGWAL